MYFKREVILYQELVLFDFIQYKGLSIKTVITFASNQFMSENTGITFESKIEGFPHTTALGLAYFPVIVNSLCAPKNCFHWYHLDQSSKSSKIA